VEGQGASDHPPFDVLVDRMGERVLLALTGEFGVDAGRRFEEAVEDLEQGPIDELTVDLSGVTSIDSTGVFLLLDAYKRFSAGARVTFEGATAQVQRSFEAVGMGGVLTVPLGGGANPAGGHMPGPDPDVAWTPGHPHHADIGLPHPELPPRRRP
jgi:anti-anti-sigma factor